MPANNNCYCPECEQKRQDESGHGISAKTVDEGCQCCDIVDSSEKNTQILLEDTKRIANALEQLVKEVKMLRAP